jgi:hypothetical protein
MRGQKSFPINSHNSSLAAYLSWASTWVLSHSTGSEREREDLRFMPTVRPKRDEKKTWATIQTILINTSRLLSP